MRIRILLIISIIPFVSGCAIRELLLGPILQIRFYGTSWPPHRGSAGRLAIVGYTLACCMDESEHSIDVQLANEG